MKAFVDHGIGKSDWLRRTWAMEPRACECGRGRVVLCGSEAGQGNPFRWGAWCPVCDDPDEHEVRPTIRWLISEVRPAVAEVVVRDPLSPSVDLRIWTARGVAIASDMLDCVARSFANLVRARETWSDRPGVWALELREDGSLWAPWCPVGWEGANRTGARLRYVERQLGPTTRKRLCVGCSDALHPGDLVWRPVNPSGTLAQARWPSDAIQTANVCGACARKAMARGVPTDDGVVYGHLRLVVGESRGEANGPGDR